MPASEIRTHDSSAAEVQTFHNVNRVSIVTGSWTSRDKALRTSEEILYHESRSRAKGKYYGILDIAISQSSFCKSAVNIQWPAAGQLARVQFRVSKFSTFLGPNPSTKETNWITTCYRLLKLLSQYTRSYLLYLRPSPPYSKWGSTMSGCQWGQWPPNAKEIF